MKHDMMIRRSPSSAAIDLLIHIYWFMDWYFSTESCCQIKHLAFFQERFVVGACAADRPAHTALAFTPRLHQDKPHLYGQSSDTVTHLWRSAASSPYSPSTHHQPSLTHTPSSECRLTPRRVGIPSASATLPPSCRRRHWCLGSAPGLPPHDGGRAQAPPPEPGRGDRRGRSGGVSLSGGRPLTARPPSRPDRTGPDRPAVSSDEAWLIPWYVLPI